MAEPAEIVKEPREKRVIFCTLRTIGVLVMFLGLILIAFHLIDYFAVQRRWQNSYPSDLSRQLPDLTFWIVVRDLVISVWGWLIYIFAGPLTRKIITETPPAL